MSGLTAEGFKELFESDPAAAFQAFITGLSRMDEEGISAIATLNDIGIAEVRLRDTLLRAVNANELFARTQNVAINAWKENTALTEEAGKRYATTESRLINLKNTALLFAQQIGDDLNPTIQNLIDGAGDLMEGFLKICLLYTSHLTMQCPSLIRRWRSLRGYKNFESDPHPGDLRHLVEIGYTCLLYTSCIKRTNLSSMAQENILNN